MKQDLPDERSEGTEDAGVPPPYLVRQDGAETGAGYLAEDQGGGDPGGEGLRDELVLQQLG